MNTISENLSAFRLSKSELKIIKEVCELADANALDFDNGKKSIDITFYNQLGRMGALKLIEKEQDLTAVGALLYAVSSICLATGFSLWGHYMAEGYVRESHPEIYTNFTHGRAIGGIALASALQELAGLKKVPLQGRKVVGEDCCNYVVNGKLDWSSNITDDSFIVVPFCLEAQDFNHNINNKNQENIDKVNNNNRAVALISLKRIGLFRQYITGLLALNAVPSAILTFDNVQVDENEIIAYDFRLLKANRTKHFLLQTFLALGLAHAALEHAREYLDGIGNILKPDYNNKIQCADKLLNNAIDVANAPTLVANDKITSIRLEAENLAVQSAHLELLLVGGKGYKYSSQTNKRFREISFLPIQSPTEIHLLHDLEKFALKR